MTNLLLDRITFGAALIGCIVALLYAKGIGMRLVLMFFVVVSGVLLIASFFPGFPS